MLNEIKQDRPGNSRFFKCPSGVTSGMPVLIGTLAAVALDAYDSTLGGTVFRLSGTFALTVFGGDSTSAGNSQAINPGDEIFATGTHDGTTNVTYNLTLDATKGNIPFGSLDQQTAVPAGQSVTDAQVKLKESNSGPGGV
jgi:predicted RecA/RadA family phage recombinase